MLIVAANGTPPLQYQWTRNGTNLARPISSSLTLTNVQLTDAGNFQVVISNATSLVTSDVVKLAVTAEESVRILLGEFKADGSFHLHISGTIGASFHLQGSTNLTQWTEVTNFVFAATTTEVADRPAADVNARFYRLFSGEKARLRASLITRLATGEFLYALTDLSIAKVKIEATSDFQQWEPVAGGDPSLGPVLFSDPAAEAGEMRYYRAVPVVK